jgi:DNA ligase-associated metallophosphoesterase
MQPAFPHRIRGQQLWLSPHRCLFWEEERSLILSDLHFGKTGHFRKAGIAVPQSVYREDLLRLLSLIQYFQPRQLLVVGDLFHSRENKELNLFRRWRDDFPDLGIRLILGNHDILHEDWYEAAGITVSREILRMGEFAFIHDITEWSAGGRDAAGTAGEPRDEVPYFFSGHLHPGIRIRGMGKQSLQFPCFYFGGQYAILPAFGRFTGTVSIDPLPESNVFAILPPEDGERRGAGQVRSSIFQIQ